MALTDSKNVKMSPEVKARLREFEDLVREKNLPFRGAHVVSAALELFLKQPWTTQRDLLWGAKGIQPEDRPPDQPLTSDKRVSTENRKKE